MCSMIVLPLNSVLSPYNIQLWTDVTYRPQHGLQINPRSWLIWWISLMLSSILLFRNTSQCISQHQTSLLLPSKAELICKANLWITFCTLMIFLPTIVSFTFSRLLSGLWSSAWLLLVKCSTLRKFWAKFPSWHLILVLRWKKYSKMMIKIMITMILREEKRPKLFGIRTNKDRLGLEVLKRLKRRLISAPKRSIGPEFVKWPRSMFVLPLSLRQAAKYCKLLLLKDMKWKRTFLLSPLRKWPIYTTSILLMSILGVTTLKNNSRRIVYKVTWLWIKLINGWSSTLHHALQQDKSALKAFNPSCQLLLDWHYFREKYSINGAVSI